MWRVCCIFPLSLWPRGVGCTAASLGRDQGSVVPTAAALWDWNHVGGPVASQLWLARFWEPLFFPVCWLQSQSKSSQPCSLMGIDSLPVQSLVWFCLDSQVGVRLPLVPVFSRNWMVSALQLSFWKITTLTKASPFERWYYCTVHKMWTGMSGP